MLKSFADYFVFTLAGLVSGSRSGEALNNVLKKPLLATFFGIVATATIIVGYLFNAIL